ncbi:hypothetical protein ABGB18_11075 [Nonomuraea sp. B12E4]|uniref:hypothetical protein n=1 Tax=Nonomuraea sp. B12E4 TaxID=3153564 RepID=UPI00325F3A51
MAETREPQRIQRKRQRGWRRPENCVIVDRTSAKWGNPRKGASHTREELADELNDTIVTAMVAVASTVDDPRAGFEAKLRKIRDRVTALEIDHG